MTGLAAGALIVLLVCAWSRRRRLVLVELQLRAAHELRGALTAVGLVIERAERRDGLAAGAARACAVELARAEQAVAALSGPACERRSPPVAVAEILAAQAQCWNVAAAARGRGLSVTCDAEATTRTDVAAFAQVTSNLVANALEHGAGAVTVSAREQGGVVRVEVADEGGGAPRGRRAVRPGRAGRGRGLTIAAEAAGRSGGTVRRIERSGNAVQVLELPGGSP